MESVPQLTRTRRRYSDRLKRRKHRLTKRLRFLLLGLKMIDAFGPPLEKLVIALIQECVAQIWTEPNRVSSGTEPYAQRQALAVNPSVRSGNARRV